VALEFGVSILVSGMPPTAVHALLRFGQLVVVGLAVGLLIGWLVRWWKRSSTNGPIEIAIQHSRAYAAYLSPREPMARGVLAVVAAGLFIKPQEQPVLLTPPSASRCTLCGTRFTFLLNGLVFLLIGLQLPSFSRVSVNTGLETLALSGAAFSAWSSRCARLGFPGARVAYFIRRRLLHQEVTAHRPDNCVGAGRYARVIARPRRWRCDTSLPGGVPFPAKPESCYHLLRDPHDPRRAGADAPPLIGCWAQRSAGTACEEREARRIAIESALRAHWKHRRRATGLNSRPLYDDLALHYRQRLAGLTGEASSSKASRWPRSTTSDIATWRGAREDRTGRPSGSATRAASTTTRSADRA